MSRARVRVSAIVLVAIGAILRQIALWFKSTAAHILSKHYAFHPISSAPATSSAAAISRCAESG